MHLKGDFYKMSNDSILCYQVDERVIMNCKGVDKYSNLPFEYPSDADIDTVPNDDICTIFPFVGVYTLGINKKWGMGHIKNLTNVTYTDDPFNIWF